MLLIWFSWTHCLTLSMKSNTVCCRVVFHRTALGFLSVVYSTIKRRSEFRSLVWSHSSYFSPVISTFMSSEQPRRPGYLWPGSLLQCHWSVIVCLWMQKAAGISRVFLKAVSSRTCWVSADRCSTQLTGGSRRFLLPMVHQLGWLQSHWVNLVKTLIFHNVKRE